jgi:hypothetical protein
VPLTSATGAHRPPVCRGDCGDGEPGELGDVVVPECAGLGDVELFGVELFGVELGVGDVELAGDVTANGSTAMAAEVPAAEWHPASTW